MKRLCWTVIGKSDEFLGAIEGQGFSPEQPPRVYWLSEGTEHLSENSVRMVERGLAPSNLLTIMMVAAVAVEIDGMIKAALGRTSPPNSPSKQRLAALRHEPAEKWRRCSLKHIAIFMRLMARKALLTNESDETTMLNGDRKIGWIPRGYWRSGV